MQAKENKKIYKHTKHYSGKLKNMLRKNYYQDKIKFFENEIRNSWKIMKEIIGKKKCNNDVLPKTKLDKIELNDCKFIAEKFSEFFCQCWTRF